MICEISDDDICQMPKIELHCHLDGSLPAALIRRLAEAQGICLPKAAADLNRMIAVPKNCQSLVEYLRCFELPVSCLQLAASLRDAAAAVAEEAGRDHVVYQEVRFAPTLSMALGLTASQIVEAVLEGFEEGERRFGVHSEAILCVMRHESIEKGELVLETAKSYLGSGVAAIDLAGDEAAYPAGFFKGLFERAVREGIPFTIHAGEAAGPDSVKAALDLGARRIGHGIALSQDAALRARCAESRIGIEMCPSSNLQTKAAAGWDTYPFPTFFKEGLLVSVNTDNRTVTDTSVSRELKLLRDHYELNKADIIKLIRNALETSFASDGLKKKLSELLL